MHRRTFSPWYEDIVDPNLSTSDLDVAIIGMAGRFPGAGSVDRFWHNLATGIGAITPSSEEDLIAAGFDPAAREDPDLVRTAARLDGIDLFDAGFFGYSPREAEAMDPQHRIFLECAWEALEDAGWVPGSASGPVGVFAGTGLSTYLVHILRGAGAGESDGLQLTVGNDKDYLTTRVSYKLDLRGPSVSVQTACSTSLVAVHMACQSLLEFACDLALAGGVSVRAPQPPAYRWQEGSILSRDGRCRAFDAHSGGTVFGNGAGVVALKRLADALRDGDHVYAIIKGSAINNDGARKVGYTAPSVDGQASVIRAALAAAAVDPETVGYVEAHGTGTPLGDPIEIAALNQVFGANTGREPCWLGAVKTSVGHLDTAAGVTGLIKAALALHREVIPPTLHFTAPNPDVPFQDGPFRVVTRSTPWRRSPQPRRAGVSSFGIGGTNAHVVLEEPPTPRPTSPSRPYQLLVTSARSAAAANAGAQRLRDHLIAHPEIELADAAYTLQVGRAAFTHRRAVVCRDHGDALGALDDPARRIEAEAPVERPSLVFLFPGQGAQYPGMAREVYETEPRFREEVDRCAELLRPHLGLDLRTILFPAPGTEDDPAARLEQTALTQPALFVVEYALARLWKSWGVRPAAMLGHSIGEYVAATLAGVFTLEDALRVVAARGQLMQAQPRGAMLSLPLPEEETLSLLGTELSLAAVNAPDLCVVSGPEEAVSALEARLETQGRPGRRLRTSHAYHSAQMEGALDSFRTLLERIRLRSPSLPFISCLTGTWITADEATSPGYWAAQLRGTVRFSDGVARVLEPGALLLEVGPGQTLRKVVARHRPGDPTAAVVPSLPEAASTRSDYATCLEAVGRLWVRGASVDWTGFHAGEVRRRVRLPTYPWERGRHWLEPTGTGAAESRRAMEEWLYLPTWRHAVPAAALERRPPPAGGSAWLIFIDAAGVGTRLAARLQSEGAAVITVRPGEAFESDSGSEFSIRSREAGDYERLATELADQGLVIHTVVHLWSVGHPACAGADALDLGFHSVVLLAQALEHRWAGWPLEWLVGADLLLPIEGNEARAPLRAALLGACRVLPQEYPAFACRLVDLPAVDHESGVEAAANCLAAEAERMVRDPIVAYRGGRRWARGYDPVRLPTPTDPAAPFRRGGVYLLTGGLGGLGLALAERLFYDAEARLVLAGRTPLPDRAGWDAWVARHGDDDPVSRRIQAVRALEDAGAEVLVVQADVSDAASVSAAVGATYGRFGALHGVFHLAGVPGGGLMQLKDPAIAAGVLAPKANGALALHEALEGRELDFVVLFSSITAVTGGLGQSDYAAANTVLGAVAEWRTSRGARTVAVDWDAWQADTWQEAALAAFPEQRRWLRKNRDRYGIRLDEGWEVLRRVLASPLPRVVVSTQLLEHVIRAHDERSRALVSRPAPTAVSTTDPATAGHPSPVSGDEIEEILCHLWQEVLGVEQVGLHDNFIDLGGHSLLAIQLVARLRQELHTDLPLRAIFEHQTVASLAEAIRSERQRGDIEMEEAARILAEVEALPAEEVRARLAALGSTSPPTLEKIHE